MGLKLNGATSGSIELDPQADLGSDRVITLNATGNSTLTLPDANGTLDRLERAGNILQVVQSSTSTEVAVTDRTYTDTGLSASITPASSSNKILVIINQGYRMSRSFSSLGFGMKIFRDSTEIYTPISDNTGPFMVYRTIAGSTSNVEYGYISMQILDAPNSTSSLTYKVQGRPYNDTNSGLVRFQQNSGAGDHQTSYITLMEVAA